MDGIDASCVVYYYYCRDAYGVLKNGLEVFGSDWSQDLGEQYQRERDFSQSIKIVHIEESSFPFLSFFLPLPPVDRCNAGKKKSRDARKESSLFFPFF